MTSPNSALGRILIVEDDAALLEQLAWALKDKFEVLRAPDAREGRSLFEADPETDAGRGNGNGNGNGNAHTQSPGGLGLRE